MKIEQSELILELREMTRIAVEQITKLKTYSLEQLNYKTNEMEWSILECIEHLRLYGMFYLPEIESRILSTQPTNTNNSVFKSGIIGEYFVNVIKVSNSKKIKATKQMDSTGSKLNRSTINEFIKQLEKLDSLLILAEKVDLNKVKTSISLSKLIKLKLGDTLRFLVYHNERHITQAMRVKVAV